MKKLLILFYLISIVPLFGQSENAITTMDFVKIVNGKREEALFFYQNNWLPFREAAYQNGWIKGFQLLESLGTDEYDLILITEYQDAAQQAAIEEHFTSWQKKHPIILLNELRPPDFRQNVRSAAGAVMAAANLSSQQTISNCEGEQNRAFDFWIGTWTVTLPDGALAGRNVILPVLGGCGLQENWTSADGVYRGKSYNFYDKVTDKWHQTWIDNQGVSLQLSGGLQVKNMVLSSQPSRNKEGKMQTDRITWVPNPNGTVEQIWEKTIDGGKTWQKVFHGIYKKST
ncbi:hypothetical protein ACSX1A_03030 [Pontibacter sp. MBLB2868]|uniref:hypothetical protein n=1 Tax=Pontibacter sp. MBLB2868 TaxID=3451555 RepID=UPI003F7549D0